MSSFARTVEKPMSGKSQLYDAGADLPDIAEAEAVLLDLARILLTQPCPLRLSRSMSLKTRKMRGRPTSGRKYRAL